MRYVLYAGSVDKSTKQYTKETVTVWMARNFNIQGLMGKYNKEQMAEHFYEQLLKKKNGTP
jgi:hypothetical protein